MRGAVGLGGAGGNRQIVLEALANLGARLARDGQQLRLVIGRQLGGEIGVLAAYRGPVRRRASPAQFDAGRAKAAGQFLCRAAQASCIVVPRCQHAATDPEATGNERAAEQR